MKNRVPVPPRLWQPQCCFQQNQGQAQPDKTASCLETVHKKSLQTSCSILAGYNFGCVVFDAFHAYHVLSNSSLSCEATAMEMKSMRNCAFAPDPSSNLNLNLKVLEESLSAKMVPKPCKHPAFQTVHLNLPSSNIAMKILPFPISAIHRQILDEFFQSAISYVSKIIPTDPPQVPQNTKNVKTHFLH